MLWDAKESQALFSELKNDKPATKPRPRPARTASRKLRRSQVPVEVWNGTLIGGLSASTGADLAKLGFPVKDGLTWPVHDISQTAIQYPPGDLAGAKLVQKVIPGGSLQQVKGLAKVRVLLGTNGYTVTARPGGSEPVRVHQRRPVLHRRPVRLPLRRARSGHDPQLSPRSRRAVSPWHRRAESG